MDSAEYNRISSLGNSYLKAKELQKLTLEQRKAYTRIGNAIRNKVYRANDPDTINERRKQQRNGTKAVENIPIPTPEIVELKPVKKRVKPLNKNTDITEGTQ